MKKSNSRRTGILLILIGIWAVGNMFGFSFPISWFFTKGLWTLLLIVPGFLGMFQENTRRASSKKLAIGMILFLICQKVLPVKTLIFLAAAMLLVHSCVERFGKTKEEEQRNGTFLHNTPDSDRYFGDAYEQEREDFEREDTAPAGRKKNGRGTGILVYSSLFSDKRINVDNERFDGADLSCTFGDMKLDIRNSFVIDDVVIEASCTLGEIEICLPEEVRVVMDGSCVLGEIKERRQNPSWADENTPVVTIKASCVLGSIAVK